MAINISLLPHWMVLRAPEWLVSPPTPKPSLEKIEAVSTPALKIVAKSVPVSGGSDPMQLSQEKFDELYSFQMSIMELMGRGKVSPKTIRKFEKLVSENGEWLNYRLLFWTSQNTLKVRSSTILHDAAKYGTAEFIPLLLRYGSYISVKEVIQDEWDFGNTALHWALGNANTLTAKVLITRSPTEFLSIKDDGRWKNTPLHLSTAKGHKIGYENEGSAEGSHLTVSYAELTLQLIQKGADVNATNASGLTPLHVACLRREVLTIKELLEHKSRLDVVDNYDRTPLELLELNDYEGALNYISVCVTAPISLDRGEYEDAENLKEALSLVTQK